MFFSVNIGRLMSLCNPRPPNSEYPHHLLPSRTNEGSLPHQSSYMKQYCQSLSLRFAFDGRYRVHGEQDLLQNPAMNDTFTIQGGINISMYHNFQLSFLKFTAMALTTVTTSLSFASPLSLRRSKAHLSSGATSLVMQASTTMRFSSRIRVSVVRV